MKLFNIAGLIVAAVLMVGCGKKVEVPPAHVGKVMTKDGYQGGVVPSSKFRLPPCFQWCDKLVLLNVADQAVEEPLTIFIPKDKLNVDVGLRVTLSLDPSETDGLFKTLTPTEENSRVAMIGWKSIYNTYAQQIILTETREYMSGFSIAEIASSLEKMNGDLRIRLTKQIEQRTPFKVRYVGITKIKYPNIITQAQEQAAQRREQIQNEEAQLQISKVKLQRELQEAQLQRQIEVEKAETEANTQRVVAASIDSRVLELRKLQNQELWIKKWNGGVPSTIAGQEASFLFQLPSN